MVTGEPALRRAFQVLLDVRMIREEKERAVLFEVELHPDETGSVSGKMVQSDTGEQINHAIVKCVPVEIEGEVVLLVDGRIGVCGGAEECTFEL